MVSLLGMTVRQEELFKIFKMAITAEKNAQNLYKKAEEVCDDEDIRAILQSFYKEEVNHEDLLMGMYKDFKSKFVTA